MSRRDLAAILRGGYCTRWHANAAMAHIRETLAEHHGRVAQIILALHPAPSVNLLDAALHHDAGKPVVGDLPYMFKRANPGLAEAHRQAEAIALASLGLTKGFSLSLRDAEWLHLADRLAGWAHVQQTNPGQLLTPDWVAERRRTVALAQALGCLPAIVAAFPLLDLQVSEGLGYELDS